MTTERRNTIYETVFNEALSSIELLEANLLSEKLQTEETTSEVIPMAEIPEVNRVKSVAATEKPSEKEVSSMEQYAVPEQSRPEFSLLANLNSDTQETVVFKPQNELVSVGLDDSIPIEWQGTIYDDSIVAPNAWFNELSEYIQFNGTINTLEGDDYILRDNAGADFTYQAENGKQVYVSNIKIYGGDGVDTVAYLDSNQGLEIDLGTFLDGGQAVMRNDPGAGSDYLYEIENIVGSNHADIIRGDGAFNTLKGADGDDRIYGENGNDDLHGEDGDDTISGGDNNDTISGGAGKDTIYGDSGSDNINGDDGDDYIEGGSGSDTITGGEGDDRMRGGNHGDWFNLDVGNDTAFGESGDDVFNVYGAGINKIDGGSGNDRLAYRDYDTSIVVDLNQNTVVRVDGIDTFTSIENASGGMSDDTLIGNADNNFFNGWEGDDTIETGAGDDYVFGDDGDDDIDGGSGDDKIFGGEGDDTIFGGIGEDLLVGGLDKDTIDGGKHSDVIRGGKGHDFMSGGAGADTFVYGAEDPDYADIISDFSAAEDKLAFKIGFFNGDNGDGQIVLSDVLYVMQFGTDYGLVADVALTGGPRVIALLPDVDAQMLTARIADGSILDTEHDQTFVVWNPPPPDPVTDHWDETAGPSPMPDTDPSQFGMSQEDNFQFQEMVEANFDSYFL